MVSCNIELKLIYYLQIIIISILEGVLYSEDITFISRLYFLYYMPGNLEVFATKGWP